MVRGSPSYESKLSGIRRYCAARGWEAMPIPSSEVSPGAIPRLLREHRPAGCIVDGVGRRDDLPPRIFAGVPVAYVGYMRGRTGDRPNFHFDTAAIASAALRELSAGRPQCYAAVGHPGNLRWPRQRVRAFRDAVRASGARCHVFPPAAPGRPRTWDEFDSGLLDWIARLPENCAIFAVCDSVAARVAQAARAARRHIPRSLTLVSVDNFADLCEGAEPPISSIQLDFERMGFVAARALAGEIARKHRQESGHGPRVPPSGHQSPPRHSPPTLVGPLLTVRRKSTSGQGRHEPWVIEAVETIRREACDGLTARELAGRFPQSRRNFERRFREAVGCSVLEEILRVRLEAATTLLSQTDTSIAAIPDMCGFSSYRALDSLFRTRFGFGMGAWRRKNAR